MTDKGKPPYSLVNKRTQETLVEDLQIADGFFSRFAGLQFRGRLPAGKGLILVPCASIHTCFMRFDLDLVLVNRRGEVLQVSRGVRPWRALVAPSQTHAVIEVTSGALPDVKAGDRLVLRGAEGPNFASALPQSLRFLAG